MDATNEFSSSISCEITVIKAKNMEFISHGKVFVRYYLPAGNKRRIQLNSREISSRSNLHWNESFSLECLGTEESINSLKQESVVVELRWRNTKPMLGKIGIRPSQLLGRAEIPWKTAFESPKMEIEKWVVMVPKKSFISSVVDDGVKPPSLQIAMRIRVPDLVMEGIEIKKKKRNGRLRSKRDQEECGCCKHNGCRCQDHEIFALVGAFEAL